MSTDFFQDLRDAVREGAHAPDLDAVHRTGRRRRRIRTAGVVAAVAVLALVGTGAAVAFPRFDSAPTGPAATPADAVSGPVRAEPVELSAATRLVRFYPLDARVAYAIVLVSPDRYAVARSLDGGRRWNAWKLPEDAQRNARIVGGEPQHAAEVADLVGAEPVFLRSLAFTIGGYLTRDGGRTWKKITGGEPLNGAPGAATSSLVGDDVRDQPENWRLARPGTPERPAPLHAIDPATGLWHRLATQPADTVNDVRIGGKGSIWTVSGDPAAGNTMVAVSHDRGRTWLKRPVTAAEGSVNQAPVSSDGVHAYVPMIDTGGGPANLVTEDGGQTWVKRPAPHAFPWQAIALPDGAVLGFNPEASSTGPPLILTRDGGQTISAVPTTNGASKLSRTVSGSYLVTTAGQTSYLVSTDGLHWSPVPLPPVGK